MWKQMDIRKIGQFIKSEREKLGMTQDELSKKIHIGREAISKWERGKTVPSTETILQLCKIINVTTDEFLAGERNTKIDVSLKLYEEQNKIRKKLKLMIVILFISTCAFLFSYFINQYKSFKVYTIMGFGENYNIENGLLIITSGHLYFTIGHIDTKGENEIKYIKIYYEHPDEKKVIIECDDDYVFLKDFRGYEAVLELENINYISNNLYIEIQGKVNETIKLEVHLDYENDKLTHETRLPSKDKNAKNTLPVDLPKSSKKLLEIIEKNFTPNFDGFTYVDNKKNYRIEYTCMPNSYFLNATKYIDDIIIEDFYYDLLYSSLDYKKYESTLNIELNFSAYENEIECKLGDCSDAENIKSRIFEELKTFFTKLNDLSK